MPKMLFSKIRFYDIKDLINGVKRPKRFDFILSRRAHKDEAVECVLARKMNHETQWKSLSLKPGCTLQPSLEQLLQDKEYQHSFRSFLQSEFSEENLDFWLACEDFRTISSEEELRRRAQQIYQEFLQTTAKREVNVDHWIREKILVSLDKPNALCFREAQKHVYALMERDSWPRYTHSQKCQSMGTKSRTLWYI
ncbi:regulator of G-protein signaling 21 [Periophthalmus magnuspinnatus]|uniref:regulator of G-protein signaling 21 n=1 Tax=Periophthalmus magnuspinnatus TaxID=409849 RepID=UPI00145AE04D|nr:regulator of G-protein signaling 21 [Periophthalmus magnuspinnatus]